MDANYWYIISKLPIESLVTNSSNQLASNVTYCESHFMLLALFIWRNLYLRYLCYWALYCQMFEKTNVTSIYFLEPVANHVKRFFFPYGGKGGGTFGFLKFERRINF